MSAPWPVDTLVLLAHFPGEIKEPAPPEERQRRSRREQTLRASLRLPVIPDLIPVQDTNAVRLSRII